MLLIVLGAGVLMVVGALFFLSSQGPVSIHMVVATILGVFVSVLLGTGLFALAFFSDKSGHDENVTDATKPHERP
ncbi:hypothetical protein [Qipengyuania oceanensis]|uniref:Uncharacterized protein n=1 Tax=Qipengyuania oceanensis TaxID=1463597 RepID=A0A844YGL5_9SPHN|nr:hypothetical protein [Qipengyuania oceanensis]MXO63281.1 hypothetical protein [Qipengyuania oceanensis]